jgi:sugar O-acyltransferase (sialic acid O-acetyltransferase NeuD family)
MSTHRDLIIFGAGGFGREIKSMTQGGCNAGHDTPRWNVIGYVDDRPENNGQSINGAPCLGPLEAAVTSRADRETWCFIALGDNEARRTASLRLAKTNWKQAVVIHNTAGVSGEVEIGPGSFIGPQVTVSPQVKIGRNALINTRASIGHHVVIGDYAQISVTASLLGYSRVDRGAVIGAHAVVMQGITVGAWATVGVCTPALVPVKPGDTICLPLPRVLFKRKSFPDDDSDN